MIADRDATTYVHDILDHAARQPAKPALVRDGRTVAYGDLPREIGALAASIRASGLAPGERVGIVTRDPIEDVLVRIAAMLVGVLACSLDPSLAPARRQELGRHYGLARLLESEECFAEGPTSIRMDPGWRDSGGSEAGHLPAAAPPARGAAMTLTSGTTGTPSAIITDHRAVRTYRRLMAEEGVVDGDTVLLNQMPHFINAGTGLTLLILMAGGTSIIPSGIRSSEDLADALVRFGITFATLPAFAIPPLIEVARRRGAKPLLPAMRTLLVGGDACEPAVLAAASEWLTPGMLQSYGSTTSGIMTVLRPADLRDRPGSAGRPFAGVTLEIEGPDGRPVPAGSEGAIRVRTEMGEVEIVGPKKISGEEVRDGWTYPGDVGRLDEAGYLYVLGRQADVIRRNGVALHPNQIERRLRPCPGVREAVVAGVPDGEAGQVPVVFVVPGEGWAPEALKAFAEDRLPESERPSDYVVVPSIPRNHLGKAVRRELVAAYLAG